MFTGLVQYMAQVQSSTYHNKVLQLVLRINGLAAKPCDFALGDSVSINGVCLTVTAYDEQQGDITVQVVPVTLQHTALAQYTVGCFVNIEPSLRASDKMHGHYVQGHVDGCACIKNIEADGAAQRIYFSLPAHLHDYLVNKAYIAIDGMSLTVAAVEQYGFMVTIIPHTRENTIVQYYTVGQQVNIEIDIMAKYAARWQHNSLPQEEVINE